jgi:hypothetical protein
MVTDFAQKYFEPRDRFGISLTGEEHRFFSSISSNMRTEDKMEQSTLIDDV